VDRVKPAVAYMEDAHPRYALRCAPELCNARSAPPPTFGAREAWLMGRCAPKGCYLGASNTPEGRASIAAAHGYEIVREEPA
jgi:hypothetical protein